MPTAPSYPQPGFDGQRGFEGAGYGHGAQMYGQEGHADPKKDKKNMMMGAAGGLAVGAVGGMVLANAMGMSCSFRSYVPISMCLTGPRVV